eukprot:Hpha_TRINITY_DN15964_c0_g2::TRINITY_DN15964_c0_g2_i1::g.73469::m.73469
MSKPGRVGKRQESDRQYDFIATIVGFKVPEGRGVGHEGKPSKWRVTWKRGDKLSGKTKEIYPSGGDVHFDHDIRFTSTIQRKSETRLHRKLVDFVVTEIRPNKSGKNDKKGSEGSLNLSSLISSLGSNVDPIDQAVLCGKDRPVTLNVRIMGKVAPSRLAPAGQDDDLLTDMPPTDAMSACYGGDLATQMDDELDDDLAGDDMGYDDEIPPARGGPSPPLPAGHRSPPLGAAPLRDRSPQRDSSIRVAKDLLALQSQLATAEAELRTTSKQLERCRQQEQNSDEALRREKKRAQEAEALVAGLRQEVEKSKAATMAEQQLGEQVLLSNIALRGGQVEGGEAQSYAILLRALLRWCALAPVNNPSGMPNTMVCNTAATLTGVCRRLGSVDTAAEWALQIWMLLLGLCTQWPQQELAPALDRAISRCRIDATTRQGSRGAALHHEALAKELRVAPLVSGTPTTVVACGDEEGGTPVLSTSDRLGGGGLSGSDRGVLMGLAAHCAACLGRCLDTVVELAGHWAGRRGMGDLAAQFYAAAAD